MWFLMINMIKSYQSSKSFRGSSEIWNEILGSLSGMMWQFYPPPLYVAIGIGVYPPPYVAIGIGVYPPPYVAIGIGVATVAPEASIVRIGYPSLNGHS